MLKRGAILGASLAMTALLAACGSQGGPGTGEEQPQTSQAPSGSQISDPKDAAAVPPCDLLPRDAATRLGVDPQGAEESEEWRKSCAWFSSDQSRSVGLSALPNRTLSEYLDNRSQYADFEELTIAGHPAVRANQNDPKEAGSCAIFLATKDSQILSSQVDFFDKSEDPCSLAQQALEATVPELPAAK
ncbi:DUF3558 domain-containing protein [Saccharopolyspora indica]|uniref:DUF3558 domain-containing protein n=1 Tax=Saccharopolyspora indica TaxID=1229659 RepID=UPI0022EBA3BE|nr:DUF3558 domain-containing protein [Saccharopolyspora indica]MDA3643660.1 DUF3558 domain-containing protein [Saccharopolyspora indica]